MKILNEIQKTLNAPKNQRNNFGNYNYRSCEDILSAVKPLLGDATLTLTDEIVLIGDRYYIKATACITDDKNHSITANAYAREDESKKGMDLSQLTGSCSSYARKYALNGLFCIDDTKDADTQDNTTQSNNSQTNDDDKEWLDLDANQQAWTACKDFYQKGMTPNQVVIKMRTKYKVSKKTATFIETELVKGEL